MFQAMSEQSMSHHGFKQLTPGNWSDGDEQSLMWMQSTSVAKTPEEWVSFFLRPVLTDAIPDSIAGLLEVARGAMIYSLLFYPLATLGAEQVYRVLEAGVRLKCEQLGLPTKVVLKDGRERDTSFSENLDALQASIHSLQPTRAQWATVHRLRNATSHPSRQMILDPGLAQGHLELAVEFLNSLFKKE